MLQKIVLLKNWNCFKISRIWRNSHLFDMLFSQKLQWVLLLQDYFKIQKCDPMLTTKILLLTRIILKTFQKKKKDSSLCFWSYFWFGHVLFHFVMLLLTYSAPRTRILSSTTHSPRFGAKSEIYYSLLLFTITIHLLLFMTLFTPNFCLFKGGCPLYFKQVFSVLISGLLS